MQELLRVHYGTEIKEVKFMLHHRCPHLTEEGRCDLWNEDPELDTRPEFCKNFLCGRAQKRRLEFDAWDMEIDEQSS